MPLGTLTGAFVAPRALVSLLGARTAGTLSDRGRRRWLVTVVAPLAGAVGTWVATSPATAAALAGALLASVTPGGVQATVPAIAGDRSHVAQHGRMVSVAYTLGDLGSAIGPALASDWSPPCRSTPCIAPPPCSWHAPSSSLSGARVSKTRGSNQGPELAYRRLCGIFRGRSEGMIDEPGAPPQADIDRIVLAALAEDIGDGDVTTENTIPEERV